MNNEYFCETMDGDNVICELQAATAEANFYADMWSNAPDDERLWHQYYESMQRQSRAIAQYCNGDALTFINKPSTLADIEAMRRRFIR